MNWLVAMALIGLVSGVSVPAFSATAVPESSVPNVSPNIALSSLMETSDGHLQKMADSLKTLALNPEVQSGDWEKIRGPLQQVAGLNVEAVNWFALPNGDYWTVQDGRAPENLSDRAYFSKVLAGQTVIGDLVVSKSTGKSTAIVAVPVYGTTGNLVGVLGASVYLDKLSELLRQELGFTDNTIYYSFDSTPLIGINWNPALILADPTKLGPDLSQAVNDMLKNNEGAESYSFLNQTRLVVYKRSNVTGWWYVFGTAQGSLSPQ